MTAQPLSQPFQQPQQAAAAQPAAPVRLSPYPRFEGQVVNTTRMVISGLSKVEKADNVVVTTDDVVRLIGEFKCVGVRHVVDKKTGDLVREQVLVPIDVDTCPWDPMDPKDDGVQRSRVIPGWKP